MSLHILFIYLFVYIDGIDGESPHFIYAGVIVLNIGSYGGGSDLWGVEDDDETDVGSHSPNRSGAVTPTEPSKLGTPTLGTPPQHRRSASHGRHGAHGGGDLSGAGGGGVAGGGPLTPTSSPISHQSS